jgi:hypothetical protein
MPGRFRPAASREGSEGYEDDQGARTHYDHYDGATLPLASALLAVCHKRKAAQSAQVDLSQMQSPNLAPGASQYRRVNGDALSRLLGPSSDGRCPGLVAAVEVAGFDPEFVHERGGGVSALSDLAIDDDGGGGQRVELVAE